MALIGICHDDTPEQAQLLTKKILNLKLWSEGSRVENGRLAETEAGKRAWSTNVMDLGGEVLCGTCFAHAVSQFMLYAKTAKGTKPDFHRAMGGEASKPFYDAFLDRMKEGYASDRIKGRLFSNADGKFGAMMDVSLVNDGASPDLHRSRYHLCVARLTQSSTVLIKTYKSFLVRIKVPGCTTKGIQSLGASGCSSDAE